MIASEPSPAPSIDRQDFENLPVFTRAGGWRQADKSFGGKLGDLVRKLNEAVAA